MLYGKKILKCTDTHFCIYHEKSFNTDEFMDHILECVPGLVNFNKEYCQDIEFFMKDFYWNDELMKYLCTLLCEEFGYKKF